MKIRLGIICLMLLGVSACNDGGAKKTPYNQNYGKYKPVLNPHPKYFLTVTGKYTSQVPVSFVAIYGTQNENSFAAGIAWVLWVADSRQAIKCCDSDKRDSYARVIMAQHSIINMIRTLQAAKYSRGANHLIGL